MIPGTAFLVSTLFTLLLIGALIYLLVKIVRSELDFSARNLLFIYAIIIVMINVLVITFGLAGLIRGLSANLRYDFGYEVYEIFQYEDDEFAADIDTDSIVTVNGEDFEIYNRDAQRNDIVAGLALTLSSLFILTIHKISIALILRNEKAKQELKGIVKIKDYIMLVTYSIPSLIIIPVAFYGVIYWSIWGVTDPLATQVIPGEALGLALAFTPLWLYYLSKKVYEWWQTK